MGAARRQRREREVDEHINLNPPTTIQKLSIITVILFIMAMIVFA